MNRICGLGIVAVLACGCGGPKVTTVRGTVTLNGKPVPAGIVALTAENHKVVTGPIDREGHYSLVDVPLGKAKVSVLSATAPVPPPGLDPGVPSPAPPQLPAVSFIPRRYENADTSGLTYSVVRTPNEFNIELTP